MPSSSVVVRSLVLAGLCLGMAPAYAQESGVTDPPAASAPQAAPKAASKSTSKAQPAKKPVRTAAKPAPKPAAKPPAKVASKAAPAAKVKPAAVAAATTAAAATAVAVVATPKPAPEDVRPLLPAASSKLLPITLASASAVPKGDTAASIAFEARSADLSDDAKAALDRLAKDVGTRHVRQIELCAFASGIEPDNRQVALARAYVVRGYLFERGVKSQIEVSGFASDGEKVDIVVPST
jgi:outer membrane protein OmpA-like peptidoglycan-associated protein